MRVFRMFGLTYEYRLKPFRGQLALCVTQRLAKRAICPRPVSVGCELGYSNSQVIEQVTMVPIHHSRSNLPLIFDFESISDEVRAEPKTFRNTPLGKELDVDLFQAFMGLWYEWEVPLILEEHGLLTESEFDAIIENTSEDAERLLSGYVKRAYFDYRKAAKFLH